MFLADVIFLFCIQQVGGVLLLNDVLIAGLILLIYFVGKIQSKQQRQSFLSFRGQANIPGMSDFVNRLKPAFDLRFEILVVVLSLLVFSGFYFAPDLAYNAISNWFLDSILNIEDTPVFGFVFKVIGFFFLLSVIMKITGGLMTLLSGGKQASRQNDDDDHFDDFTEIK